MGPTAFSAFATDFLEGLSDFAISTGRVERRIGLFAFELNRPNEAPVMDQFPSSPTVFRALCEVGRAVWVKADRDAPESAKARFYPFFGGYSWS